MRITRTGRQALLDYPDGDSSQDAATLALNTWKKLVDDAKVEPLDGDLRRELVPTEVGEPALRRVAHRVLDDGLHRGGSAFAPGLPVWSAETVAELRRAFVDQPDAGGDSFENKLAKQLVGCSDEAILLCAEILALQMLPLADWKVNNKRGRIKRVLALMADPVGMPADVNAAMDTAILNGSLTFKTLIWRTLTTAIEVATAWWQLDKDGREHAWSDPWAWRDLLADAPGDTIRSALAELRYLHRPDTFCAIISIDHQKRIRDVFAPQVGVPVTADLERDIYSTAIAMQQREGKAVAWYLDPVLEPQWLGGHAGSAGPVVAGRHAWLVRGSNVLGVDVTPDWYERGYVSLAASQLPALARPASREETDQAVESGYTSLAYAKRTEKQRDIAAFVLTMQPDDLVLSTSGNVIRAGTVTGDWSQTSNPGGRSNLRRSVTWVGEEQAADFAELPAELKGQLGSSSDVTDITDQLAQVEALIEVVAPPPLQEVTLTPLGAEHADELLVGKEWLDDFVALLSAKRQVIAYGPPGTGKTYLAQQIAAAVAPQGNTTLVQFHPAYAYEDFFEGYRPFQDASGTVGFRLRPGPFRKVAEAAREHPDQPFVLIIDEINRANLASVFGELYFLLEYRDQAIDLLYQPDDGKQFTLPKNVFIIGTMNTADRSIALVDSAMRRRFAFLSLRPEDEALHGLLRAWLEREQHPTEAADLLDALNSKLEDTRMALGPSYLMTAEVATEQGLDRIWRTQIMPLLEEEHIGEDVDVQKRYGLAAMRARVARAKAETGDETLAPSAEQLAQSDVADE